MGSLSRLARLDDSGTKTSQRTPSVRAACATAMPALPPDAITTPAGALVRAHAVEHAARLEAAADLQVLQLQPQLGAVDAQLAAADPHDRSAAHVGGDPTLGVGDVGTGRCP